MLFECLTVEPPFERASEVATVYAHLTSHRRVPRGAAGDSRGLRRRLRTRACEGARRPLPSCGELARASEAALRGELPGVPGGVAGWLSARSRPGMLVAVTAAAGIVLRDDGGGNAAPPEAGHRAEDDGPHRRQTHKVVGQIPLAGQPWDVAFDARQAWVMLGDERRIARVGLTSHKVLSSTQLPSARAASQRRRGGLGDRGRRPGAPPPRREDRDDREALLGADPKRSALELDGDRLRRGLGLGRARARDRARRSGRRQRHEAHPDPARGDLGRVRRRRGVGGERGERAGHEDRSRDQRHLRVHTASRDDHRSRRGQRLGVGLHRPRQRDLPVEPG